MHAGRQTDLNYTTQHSMHEGPYRQPIIIPTQTTACKQTDLYYTNTAQHARDRQTDQTYTLRQHSTAMPRTDRQTDKTYN